MICTERLPPRHANSNMRRSPDPISRPRARCSGCRRLDARYRRGARPASSGLSRVSALCIRQSVTRLDCPSQFVLCSTRLDLPLLAQRHSARHRCQRRQFPARGVGRHSPCDKACQQHKFQVRDTQAASFIILLLSTAVTSLPQFYRHLLPLLNVMAEINPAADAIPGIIPGVDPLLDLLLVTNFSCPLSG